LLIMVHGKGRFLLFRFLSIGFQGESGVG
jgi:hypothetical protein